MEYRGYIKVISIMTTKKVTTPPEQQLSIAVDQIKLGLKNLQSALDDIALRIHKAESFHCQFERDAVYWRDRSSHLKDVDSMDLWAEAKTKEDAAVKQVNELRTYIDELKEQYDTAYDSLTQYSKSLAINIHELQKSTTLFMELKATLGSPRKKPSIEVKPKELTVDEELELMKKELLK